jgi:diadenosine tetraphosphate (Ap4A) HIT family hydrolase
MNTEGCPFCEIINKVEEGDRVLRDCYYHNLKIIYDKYPVSKGHVLIIPYRHVSNYFDLLEYEKENINFGLNLAKEILDKKYNPDGYNIGVNVGEKAGQTIDHVHIHLIPRYDGDIENPEGGVRGVIPSKRIYK